MTTAVGSVQVLPPQVHPTTKAQFQPIELPETALNRFSYCEYIELTTDHYFLPHTHKKGMLETIATIEVDQCITIFGIGVGDNRCILGSRLNLAMLNMEQNDEEIVRRKLAEIFEDRTVNIDKLHLYLVGGNSGELSTRLSKALMTVLPQFFNKSQIVGTFFNPNEGTPHKFITVTLNMLGKSYFYRH